MLNSVLNCELKNTEYTEAWNNSKETKGFISVFLCF